MKKFVISAKDKDIGRVSCHIDKRLIDLYQVSKKGKRNTETNLVDNSNLDDLTHLDVISSMT